MNNLEKQQLKLAATRFARTYVSYLLRGWRSYLYSNSLQEDGFLELKKLRDKDMSELIGVTPTAFSRISSGACTCSSTVLCKIYSAMKRSLGENRFKEIENGAYIHANRLVYGNN